MPIIPDPDIADFESSVFQITRQSMRHVGEAKHSDMRTGFQDSICFCPNSAIRKDSVPFEILNLLPVWWINDSTINAILFDAPKDSQRITGFQSYIGHFELLFRWRKRDEPVF